MKYPYKSVEIAGVGSFTVPAPVWELLLSESERATVAERKWKDAVSSLDVITRMSNEFLSRAETAEAHIERVRVALGGCPDNDLASLATTLKARASGAEYLAEGKDEIFELLVRIRDEFDGTDYQQGKKDGLRTALALLGMPEMNAFNRGNGGARE